MSGHYEVNPRTFKTEYFASTLPDISPHYAVGGLAMAARLAADKLPTEPQHAKLILEDALKTAQPHMTPELRDILEQSR